MSYSPLAVLHTVTTGSISIAMRLFQNVCYYGASIHPDVYFNHEYAMLAGDILRCAVDTVAQQLCDELFMS